MNITLNWMSLSGRYSLLSELMPEKKNPMWRIPEPQRKTLDNSIHNQIKKVDPKVYHRVYDMEAVLRQSLRSGHGISKS